MIIIAVVALCLVIFCRCGVCGGVLYLPQLMANNTAKLFKETNRELQEISPP